jgi:hypothetical protein
VLFGRVMSDIRKIEIERDQHPGFTPRAVG